MRKTAFTATAATLALTLVACSDNAPPAEEAIAEPAAATTAETAAPAAALDANTASAEQLGATEGMTAELAAAVVAGRPYATVVDLDAKLRETLSEEQAAAALANVFVPVNLNSASEDEIKLIPGMTERMVHEFLEYRPYEDMAEFDREIGKYVDAAEVARFRRYVTL
jgi:DNA uptake protein ComE-like DNA-binding protein